jgi:hypothetical protein
MMPRPRVRKNGVPDEMEIVWSPMEVAVVVLLLGSIVGFGSWLAVGQIALGREMGETRGAVETIQREMDVRVQKANEEHARYMTRDEFNAWVEGGKR